MAEDDNGRPGLGEMIRRVARTGFAALQNRGELFSVEWQEEKIRLTEAVVCAAVAALLGVLGLGMLTAFFILLFRPDLRIYALAGFAVLYLAGAVVAWTNLKGLLTKHEPFAETIDQVRKDAEWLDSLR